MNAREPGFYDNVPEAEYHADTSTLSASSAKTLLGKRPPKGTSDAMRFGTLVHLVILEPHREAEFTVLDPETIGVKSDGSRADNPKMTAAWKKAVLEAEEAGSKVVEVAELATAHAMRDAVHQHPVASRLLALAQRREVSAYANHPSGAMVRGRFDALTPNVVVDLKTTDAADPAKLPSKYADLGYHISAANYLDIAAANGHPADAFAFINVERDPTPAGRHRVTVVELHPEAIDLGRQLMAEACQRWLALGRVVDLPDYGDGIHTIDLPDWAYRQAPPVHLGATA